MFHPDGVTFAARVEGLATAPDLQRVARRLEGQALVRLSSAWWRGRKEWLDALGLAVRFEGGQDLLCATIRFPFTTPFAPLTTRVHSFLWNHYHAVSPFKVEDVRGRVKLRLRSPRLMNETRASRAEHLLRMVDERRAVWQLEARRIVPGLWRRRWEPFACLTLTAPIAVDQAALRFSPFNDRRGLTPVGFVHALRVWTYAASQGLRPRCGETLR